MKNKIKYVVTVMVVTGIDDDGDYNGNDYGIVTAKEEVTVIDMEETMVFVSVDIVVVWWWWWSLWLKKKFS